MPQLKNNIRRLRFDHDEMTQLQLADALHVSRQTIHAIEKGKFNPSVKLALEMASYFNIKMEELFWIED